MVVDHVTRPKPSISNAHGYVWLCISLSLGWLCPMEVSEVVMDGKYNDYKAHNYNPGSLLQVTVQKDSRVKPSNILIQVCAYVCMLLAFFTVDTKTT